MHDYQAVKALLERLTGSDDLRADRVAEVRIRAGVIFSPEALLQSYEMLTQDTPLEGSRLVIDEMRDERVCSACGISWTVTRADLAGHVLICPSCGAPSSVEGSTGIELVGITDRSDPGPSTPGA
jgi:Zn finger protein HypA/HybF involved in hydrogenase expression